MLVGSRLGRRLQETAKTREKGEKQAKRPFLHLPSPVLLEDQGLSLSQETGNPLHTCITTQLRAWIPSPSPETEPPDTPRVITPPAIDTAAEFQGSITQGINI